MGKIGNSKNERKLKRLRNKREKELFELKTKNELGEMKIKGQKKARTFWKDFKKFITKGNIIDLAVAVVIGAAFNKIVTGLVNYIITPLVSLLVGGIDMASWKWVLKAAETELLTDGTEKILKAEVAVLYGAWLQAIMDFLIVALCIFVALRIIMKAKEKLNAKELEKAKADAERKKEEEKLKADADAKAAAEKAETEKQFYLNVAKQAQLLGEIKELLANKK